MQQSLVLKRTGSNKRSAGMCMEYCLKFRGGRAAQGVSARCAGWGFDVSLWRNSKLTLRISSGRANATLGPAFHMLV